MEGVLPRPRRSRPVLRVRAAGMTAIEISSSRYVPTLLPGRAAQGARPIAPSGEISTVLTPFR